MRGTKIFAGTCRFIAVGNRRAVIAGGRRGHSCGRYFERQQVGEGATNLEGAAVLQKFKLEN